MISLFVILLLIINNNGSILPNVLIVIQYNKRDLSFNRGIIINKLNMKYVKAMLISITGLYGTIFSKYAIELEIDSNDAFDYENPDNAKYSVE